MAHIFQHMFNRLARRGLSEEWLCRERVREGSIVGWLRSRLGESRNVASRAKSGGLVGEDSSSLRLPLPMVVRTCSHRSAVLWHQVFACSPGRCLSVRLGDDALVSTLPVSCAIKRGAQVRKCIR